MKLTITLLALFISVGVASAQTKPAAKKAPVKSSVAAKKMDCCKGADACRRGSKAASVKKSAPAAAKKKA